MQAQMSVNPWGGSAHRMGCGECGQRPTDGGLPFACAYRKHGGQSPSRPRDNRSCDPVDCGNHRLRSRGHWLAALGWFGGVPCLHRVHGRCGLRMAGRVPLSYALRHPRAISRALLRRDRTDGTTDVPLESAAVVCYRGNYSSLLGAMGVAMRKGVT